MEKSAVAVIDDDDSIRRSLPRLLSSKGYQVHAFGSAQEFLSSREVDAVACVISDLKMPDLDGLQFQEALSAKRPDLSLVFITGHGDVPASVVAMKAGAVDFLEKPIKSTELMGAIQRAIERTDRLKTASAQTGQLKVRYARLTPREREVFALVAAGLLNKQIGAELGAAEKTIKQHRGRIMQKMEAESLADLVVMAAALGVRPTGVDFSKAKGLVPSS